MTRLTLAFSMKWENLEAAYALWFAYYNFAAFTRHYIAQGCPNLI